MSTDLIQHTNGEFDLSITPHAIDGFRVLAPGLAKALGFREAYNLLRSIPDQEKGSTLVWTPGGQQAVGYLTEAGFYRALGQRQSARIADDAARGMVERFQAWVYGEVLPSLRKGETTPARDLATLGARDILVIAQRLVEQEERADRAEVRAERSERVVSAIEAAEGLTPTQFHKHYFSDIRESDFFEALYRHHLLIDQRGSRGRDAKGRLKSGYEHQHPRALGKAFFYLHGRLDSEGVRRESVRVRPGRPEVQLVEFLAGKGLTPNANALTTTREIAA